MAKKKVEPQVQKKSVEVVKKERIQDILDTIEPLTFDDKIGWFTQKYKDFKGLYIGNELTDENFICYVIAEMKIFGKYTTIEDAFQVQLEHFNILLSNPLDELDAFAIQRIKRNKKYLEALVKKDEPETESANDNLRVLPLNWTGNNNALIDIFYQLKKMVNTKGVPLITNSNEEVSHFLKNNFECFSNTRISTIHGQLKASKRPKMIDKKITIECEK